MSTQVILTANLDRLGGEGDTVAVADGYARNYLFPRGLALPATTGNLRRVDTLRKKRDEQRTAELTQAKETAALLVKRSYTIVAAAGPDEKLYGSVTATDIADMLKKHGVEVDRRKIVLEHAIRTTGVFDVDVKLHPEVPAKVKVWVTSEGAAAPASTAAKESEAKGRKTTKKK